MTRYVNLNQHCHSELRRWNETWQHVKPFEKTWWPLFSQRVAWSADAGLCLFPPCVWTHFIESRCGCKTKLKHSRPHLHVCMLMAWKRLQPQPFSATTFHLQSGDQSFQTIALAFHTFSGEWKPCAVSVSDGQTGAQCWQALRCTSALDNAAKTCCSLSFLEEEGGKKNWQDVNCVY